MQRNLKIKVGLILGLLVIALLLIAPSLMWDYTNNQSRMPDFWRQARILPTRAVVMGLDLQGGMHLVVSVDTEEAVRNELYQIKDGLRSVFKEEKIKIDKIEVLSRDKIQVSFLDSENLKKGTDYIKNNYNRVLLETNEGSTLAPIYVLDDAQAEYYRGNATRQVMETLHSRIDEFGVAEPSIQRQGKDRIVLQLPGIKEEDRNRVLNIIQRTAKLEFMLVETFAASKEALLERLGGSLPSGRRLLPEVDKDGKIVAWYLLKEEPKITGDYLVDARPIFGGGDLGGALVSFQWNIDGARRFSRITGEHIGENLAIVLEDKVRSAPVIKDRIFDRGQIEGNFTPQEATDLAIVLRAGALPVGIKIEEERTVGPTLGKDLIERGMLAGVLAGASVIVFMVVYYSFGGVVASIALILNLLFIFAVLAILRATLTLPGIAGIALTVGMMVDANIIIFERIREELRIGKNERSAIEAGFARSLWTILDANITTLIAAAILFQIGTGPIRGFAVTLTIGVVGTVFCGLVVSKTIYELWFALSKKTRKLNIGIKI